MSDTAYTRYSGGCVMLLRREGDAVAFIGTAFLVHPDGYLLTVAHILPESGDLMVSPRDFGMAFSPQESETVATLPATVVRVDRENDVALLTFQRDTEILMPDHVIGAPDDTLPGSTVACLGFPFGFYQVYNQCIYQAVVTAKILSPVGMKFFLFDAISNEGLRGGPLVDVNDGRIIGIVGGCFHPGQLSRHPIEDATAIGSSYAISIEYGAALLQAEGIAVL